LKTNRKPELLLKELKRFKLKTKLSNKKERTNSIENRLKLTSVKPLDSMKKKWSLNRKEENWLRKNNTESTLRKLWKSTPSRLSKRLYLAESISKLHKTMLTLRRPVNRD
jgi:hypothetical protein